MRINNLTTYGEQPLFHEEYNSIENLSIASNVCTIDVSNSNFVKNLVSASGTFSIAFSNTESLVADQCQTIELWITTGTSALTVSFPSTIKWVSSVPDFSDTNTLYCIVFRIANVNINGTYKTLILANFAYSTATL